ncbi:hypothetical protein GLAREA_04933 [Glarea lozoyensis ATCC 20868]|uniref:Amidoligase enzyme n=1 Tax=Glarea lozoyensis (strain ATCC 20868 / MF5171) TaxID=1116229 RepID=S3CNP9_GLAL2|nr:uncharacterized protein GLAREA_04933 [Glarea lozoyensis ATCC 20868]EPE28142.1 hypothetical protein GLAREA_04933 [Glarea lozoyensis ATCC 20868]
MASSKNTESPLDLQTVLRLFSKEAFELTKSDHVLYNPATKPRVLDSNDTTANSGSPLTFGVEFEFAFPRLAKFSSDASDETDAEVRKSFALLLNEAGIPAEFQPSLQREKLGNAYLTKTFEAKNPAAWYVKSDTTINQKAAEHKPITHHGVEIVSPPFFFSEAALDQVQYVCYLLLLTNKIKIDSSCALHVHIGNGVKGFTFDEVQAFTALYWTFEPQLQSIQPTSRISNNHSASLRTNSNIYINTNSNISGVDSMQRNEARGGLEWILNVKEEEGDDGANGIDRLYKGTIGISGTHDHDRPALNLRQLSQSATAHPIKKTMESRQHQMTLDPERVCHWISTCHGLVKEACALNSRNKFGFRYFLYLNIDHTPKEFDLPDLLKYFGLFQEAAFYEKMLCAHDHSLVFIVFTT